MAFTRLLIPKSSLANQAHLHFVRIVNSLFLLVGRLVSAADANGRFTLAAEPGNTLVVSLVGYDSKEIAVSSGTADLHL